MSNQGHREGITYALSKVKQKKKKKHQEVIRLGQMRNKGEMLKKHRFKDSMRSGVIQANGERSAQHVPGHQRSSTETHLAITAETVNLAPCLLLGAVVPESPAGTGTPVASASVRSHKQYRNHFWLGCK